jgi:DNA-directed RNA polymerase III subunit RPC4
MGSSTSGSKPKRTKVKRENQAPNYVSSGSELGSDGGKRKKKNIERINLISSDEEDDEDQDFFSENAKGKQRERTPHIPSNLLRPVRIQRQEHVERTVGVNTDASSLTSAKLRQRAKDHQDAGSSLFLNEDDAGILTTTKAKGRRKPKDVEFVRNERKWKGVYQDEDIQDAPAKIKDEPKDDEEVMVTDTPVPNREPDPMAMDEEDGGVPLHTAIERSLPQPGKTLKVTETLDESGKAFDDGDSPRPTERRPRTVEFVGDEPALTAEECDEFFANVSEMLAAQANIQEEPLTSAPATATKGHDADSDTDMDNKADDVFLDDEEERYGYVFQLPPIIPSLRDASKKVISPKTEKRIKPKGSNQTPSSNPFNVHPKDDAAIKSDPDDLTREPTYPNAYIAGGLHAPGGQVGVLNIYKKGPMRAFWGGMSLEISKGESGDMVPQEMVLTDFTNTVTKVEDESRWEEKVNVGEKGWAMGQTQRGFVCVPDWGALLS